GGSPGGPQGRPDCPGRTRGCPRPGGAPASRRHPRRAGAAHPRAPRRPRPPRPGGTGRAGGRRAAPPARHDPATAAVHGQAPLQEGVVAVNQDWPVAELDPVRRMRVIAAATPGVAYAEKLIPAPFSAVWDAASDLEHELPRMVTDLRSFKITST